MVLRAFQTCLLLIALLVAQLQGVAHVHLEADHHAAAECELCLKLQGFDEALATETSESISPVNSVRITASSSQPNLASYLPVRARAPPISKG